MILTWNDNTYFSVLTSWIIGWFEEGYLFISWFGEWKCFFLFYTFDKW